MRYLILPLLLFPLCSRAAESNDTYNFYFQKAPGPATVNQGVAPAKSAEAAPLPAAVPAPAADSHANVVSALPAAEDERSRWRLYAGYTDSNPLMGSMSEYIAGTEFALSRVISFQADVRDLKEIPIYVTSNQQSRYGFSAGVLATPLQIQFGKILGIRLSAAAGAVSVPVVTQGSSDPSDFWDQKLDHVLSPYFGARLGIEFFRTVELALNVNKVTHFDGTMASATVGIAL